MLLIFVFFFINSYYSKMSVVSCRLTVCSFTVKLRFVSVFVVG